jgi:hypothetical protein
MPAARQNRSKLADTSSQALPAAPHIRRRQRSRCCGNSFHGAACLSWNRHPKPTGSRRATPLPLFQHSAGQSRGLAVRTLMRPPRNVAHEVFVELVVGLAGLLRVDERTFVFFVGHGSIVAYGGRSNQEDWPPLWMVAAEVLKVECKGRAEVRKAKRQRSLPGGPRPAIWARGSVARLLPAP